MAATICFNHRSTQHIHSPLAGPGELPLARTGSMNEDYLLVLTPRVA
jgi:hypothetical protein